MVWPPFLKSSHSFVCTTRRLLEWILGLSDGDVIVSGVWGQRLRLWSDHEETDGQEYLSSFSLQEHNLALSSWERPDSYHSILWDTPFSALTRVQTRLSANRITPTIHGLCSNSVGPISFVWTHNWMHFNKKSTCRSCKIFSHHGLCSDSVGPSQLFFYC
jgi:hypothetical protein